MHALKGRKEISTTAQVFTLANELLASIFKHLNGFELCTVAKTCQRFRAASQIDQIWQHLCERGISQFDLFTFTVLSTVNLIKKFNTFHL